MAINNTINNIIKTNNSNIGFLNKVYYGNTLSNWLYALLVFVLFIMLAKVVAWISKNILRKLTRKTKIKFDDIVFDLLEKPVVFSVILFGFYLSTKVLVLTPFWQKVIDKFLYFAVVANIAWFISRFLDSLIVEYLMPLTKKTKSDLDDQIIPILKNSVNIIVWILAILIALNNAGYNVSSLIAGLGIGGLAVAMAAKDTIANMFGSFTVLIDKPFKIKDRIQIKGFDGTVVDMHLRSTRLKDLNGRIVTIPNAFFASEPIINISSEKARKIKINLGLVYDTKPEDLEKAMKLLKKIINSFNGVDKEKTSIYFTEFGDSALNILAVYYITDKDNIFSIKSKINLKILKEFNKHGLEFAYPTQTIYLKKEE